MKTVIITLGTAGLLTVASHADMTFAAPGMEKVQSYQGLNLQEVISLGEYWRYEVTGYEWRLVAGTPYDGAVQPDTGKLVISKNDNGQYQGSSVAQAHVAGSKSGTQWVIGEARLSAFNIKDYEVAASNLASPIVFNAENVSVGFRQVTNMTGDYGSYILIQGASIKDAPVPTGTMTAPELVELESLPEIQYTISREGISGSSPSFSPSPWNPSVTPGETTTTPPTEGETPEGGEDTTESSNSGKNKSNNGHGNNEDGVDVSNPGKSAEKWESKGIYDESTLDDDPNNDDDESKGGGAGPSKNK